MVHSDQRKRSQLSFINQLILDTVAEGIYGIDLNANVIFWNKAAEELTGFRIEDFNDNNLHDLIHHTTPKGEAVPVFDCPVYHSLKDCKSLFVGDDLFWRKDGTSFPVEYTVKPIIEQGIHTGSVITFRDVTEKKKTEEMMLQWEKLSMVGQLAAGIAHEIRNPITALKGFLQLIKSSQEIKDSYFDIMDSEFDRIETIVNELLVFSKPQSSQYAYHELNDLTDQVVLLMEPQAILRNVRILTEFKSSPLEIYCIEHQMKQVLINLIKNAMEAMDESGDIIIRLEQNSKDVIIEIEDEGTGIPEDVLQKIGEPFYSTKQTGTGLGIMVTNNIIRNNHHGSIRVESKVNQGTTFTIGIPTDLEDKIPH